MPNGKHGDHPLSDLMIHGHNTFPDDIRQLIVELYQLDKERALYSELWTKSWYWSNDYFPDKDREQRREEGRRWLREQIQNLKSKE